MGYRRSYIVRVRILYIRMVGRIERQTRVAISNFYNRNLLFVNRKRMNTLQYCRPMTSNFVRVTSFRG